MNSLVRYLHRESPGDEPTKCLRHPNMVIIGTTAVQNDHHVRISKLLGKCLQVRWEVE